MNAVTLLFNEILSIFNLHDKYSKCIISEANGLVTINNLNLDSVTLTDSLDKLASRIQNKVYLGLTGYIEFHLLRDMVTKDDTNLYTFIFSYSKVENYESYFEIIPKEILLSIATKIGKVSDFLNLVECFPKLITEKEYLMMSRSLYPNFSRSIFEVVSDLSYYDKCEWEFIFLFLRYHEITYSLSLDLHKFGTLTEKEDVDILRRCINEIIAADNDNVRKLKGILNKLFLKYEYPYMYFKIKDIYTLKNFEDNRLGISIGSRSHAIYEYLKTGKIKQPVEYREVIDSRDIISIYLLIKDHIIDINLYMLENISKTLEKVPSPFYNTVDFLNKANVDKNLLRELLIKTSHFIIDYRYGYEPRRSIKEYLMPVL
jgi:hypothetical protein